MLKFIKIIRNISTHKIKHVGDSASTNSIKFETPPSKYNYVKKSFAQIKTNDIFYHPNTILSANLINNYQIFTQLKKILIDMYSNKGEKSHEDIEKDLNVHFASFVPELNKFKSTTIMRDLDTIDYMFRIYHDYSRIKNNDKKTQNVFFDTNLKNFKTILNSPKVNYNGCIIDYIKKIKLSGHNIEHYKEEELTDDKIKASIQSNVYTMHSDLIGCFIKNFAFYDNFMNSGGFYKVLNTKFFPDTSYSDGFVHSYNIIECMKLDNNLNQCKSHDTEKYFMDDQTFYNSVEPEINLYINASSIYGLKSIAKFTYNSTYYKTHQFDVIQ